MIYKITPENQDIYLEFLEKLVPYDVLGLHKIRLGNDVDGGYILPKETIYPCDALLSLGVEKDISFEEDLLQIQNMPIYCVDHSIWRLPERSSEYAKELPFFHERKALVSKRLFDIMQKPSTIAKIRIMLLRRAIFSAHKAIPMFIMRMVRKTIKVLLKAISKELCKKVKARFIPERTPKNLLYHTVKTEEEFIQSIYMTTFALFCTMKTTYLEQLLQTYHLQDKKLGIKMDIENSELIALEDFDSALLSRTQFLLLEIHTLMNEYIVNKLNPILDKILSHMTLVHIHANNNAFEVEMNGITFPEVCECTFINNSFVKELCTVAEIPHSLDRACYPLSPEIYPNFLEKILPTLDSSNFPPKKKTS